MKYLGLNPAKILMPKTDDMNAWSIVACDQFTSEKEYWDALENHVKGKLSTFNLVLPEIYLEDDLENRIKVVNANIKKYLEDGVFETLPEGFILTVRKTPYVERRIGLIGMLDLDEYLYGQKTEALIRSTEGTVEERIPPRLKIREKADVEFPHVMVLFDDEERNITEKLYENRSEYKKLYDFTLNMGGGSIEGYFVPANEELLEKFSNLLSAERLIKKYGKEDKFAFAVGDGNHSLATAKTHWNKVKQTLTEEEKLNHPARFALAEFVNIYDEGIYFEPIHRFIKGVDEDKFIQGLNKIDGGNIGIIAKGINKSQKSDLALADGIKAIDEYIKEYIGKFGGVVDYIHGDENLKNLIEKTENSVGITFDKLDKKELFRYVSNKGAFPRKTFSMGEGVEKRYYLEGRRITK